MKKDIKNSQRGAALIQYLLLVSLLVVISIGAIGTNADGANKIICTLLNKAKFDGTDYQWDNNLKACMADGVEGPEKRFGR